MYVFFGLIDGVSMDVYACVPRSATLPTRDVVGKIDDGERSVGFVRARYRRRRRRRRGLVRAAVRLVSVRCTHRNEPPHRVVRYAHGR